MLMRFLIVLTILVYSATASAQQLDRAEINKALQSIKSVPLKHKGQDGVWFSVDDADKLLQLVQKKLPQALDTIDAQTEQAKALNIAIDAYKTSNNQYLKVAELTMSALDVALKYIPQIIPPNPPWYKSGKAVYIYGVLTGAGAVIGSALVVKWTVGSK